MYNCTTDNMTEETYVINNNGLVMSKDEYELTPEEYIKKIRAGR